MHLFQNNFSVRNYLFVVDKINDQISRRLDRSLIGKTAFYDLNFLSFF